jgi:hypothetical protein
LLHCNIFFKGFNMFTNTPFEAAAKAMKENAEKFNPASAQEAFKPMMAQLQAWTDLAQKQAQSAQVSMAATMESFKAVKEPQSAFEAMKASAENSMAMATQNLKDVTALGVSQFHTSVDAIEKAHPAPEAFSNVAKGMKDAASKMEVSIESAMKQGSAAIKKTRGG